MPAEPRSWIRWAVLALFLGLGAWLRLRGLASVPLFGDEYHTLTILEDGQRVDLCAARYGTILTSFDTNGSHVALPLLQRLSMDLFGRGIVRFRLVAIVPGLLLLLLAYPLLRAFVSADAAALATAMLAVNPMVVYYARFARGYALALFLALVLVWAVRRLLEPAGRTRWTWSALIAAGALLPWVHLSTAGFALAVALAGIALALRESRALAWKLLGAFALAAGIALLLFVPVFGQVLAYFRLLKTEPAPFTVLGVPTLLAGGRLAACLWLAALPVGAWVSWRARRASVLLAGAALLGPLTLLVLTDPPGMDYSWARYVLSALPLLAALVAAAATELGAPVAGTPAPAVALGAALLAAQHWTGPLGPHAPADGGFSNTYLALHPLPVFDEPYPAMPEFYRRLAADPAARRIVETPPIYTRAVLELRNFALQHGKEVRIGWVGELYGGIERGPYVRPLEVTAEQADYLVLHRDPLSEVPAYFRYVYEDLWPRVREPADDSYMRRQETIYAQNLLPADKIEPIAARLSAVLGPTFYEDDAVLVWKLAR